MIAKDMTDTDTQLKIPLNYVTMTGNSILKFCQSYSTIIISCSVMRILKLYSSTFFPLLSKVFSIRFITSEIVFFLSCRR